METLYIKGGQLDDDVVEVKMGRTEVHDYVRSGLHDKLYHTLQDLEVSIGGGILTLSKRQTGLLT